MSFVMKTWKDTVAEYPTRRILHNVIANTDETVTVTRSIGTVTQEGDVFNAATMNGLETRIKNAFDAAPQEYGTCTNYSSSATYALNALVIYNKKLYKCTTAISTAEAWTAAHWTQVTPAVTCFVYNTSDSKLYAVRGADTVTPFNSGSFNIDTYENNAAGIFKVASETHQVTDVTDTAFLKLTVWNSPSYTMFGTISVDGSTESTSFGGIDMCVCYLDVSALTGNITLEGTLPTGPANYTYVTKIEKMNWG